MSAPSTLTQSHQLLQGRAAWTGAELERTGDWIRVLNPAQQQEIDDALARVRRQELPLFGFPRDDFPLPRTASLLSDISNELERGRGAARLRGLDTSRYSEDDLRQIFWGI